MKNLIPCILFILVMTHLAKAADDDFPVYSPHATLGGVRAEEDYPIVDTVGYKGAIVPAEEAARNRFLLQHYRTFWTPLPEDIARAETKVFTFIDALTSAQGAEIRRKLAKFRRQYVGYVAEGEKRILCSFLPGVKEGQDPFINLRRSFIKVFDGGPSFWSIEYLVDKETCERFYVDGGY